MHQDDMPARFPATCVQCGDTFTARRYNVLRGKDKFCGSECREQARWRDAPSLVERFWAKVDRNGPIPVQRPDLGPCWIWTGSRTQGGYGKISLKSLGRGQDERASRISWEIHFGAIPDGLWALHHCDNPPCVRPTHLFLGTQFENMTDMAQKGRDGRQLHPERFPVGSAVKTAKLTERDVLSMRTSRAAGERIKDLAVRFGLSLASTKDIIYGRQWRHVGGPTGHAVRLRPTS